MTTRRANSRCLCVYSTVLIVTSLQSREELKISSKGNFQRVVEKMRDLHPEAYTRLPNQPLSTNHDTWKKKVLSASDFTDVGFFLLFFAV